MYHAHDIYNGILSAQETGLVDLGQPIGSVEPISPRLTTTQISPEEDQGFGLFVELGHNTPPKFQDKELNQAWDINGKIVNVEAEAEECVKLLIQLGCQVADPAHTKANI